MRTFDPQIVRPITQASQTIFPMWGGSDCHISSFRCSPQLFRTTITKTITSHQAYTSSQLVRSQFIVFRSRTQSSVSSFVHRSATDLPDFNPYVDETHLPEEPRDPRDHQNHPLTRRYLIPIQTTHI